MAPPGGEASAEVVARMRGAVDRAAASLGHEAALLVSHGAAIRMLVGSITGQVPPPLDNGALFRIAVAEGTLGLVERLR